MHTPCAGQSSPSRGASFLPAWPLSGSVPQEHVLPRPPASHASQPTHQAATLLAPLHPGVTAVVHGLPVLVEALTAQPGVTLGAAEQINGGVLAVTDHAAAHDEATLGEGPRQFS